MKPIFRRSQIDEERKSKALIQVSLGVSIVLHLLMFVAVAPKPTDPADLDDDSRAKPLIVELKEETPTQASSLAPTTSTKEHYLKHAWYPEVRSLATSNTKTGIRSRERDAAGQLDQHVVTQAEPSEIRQMEPKGLVAPEINQERTATPDIGGTPKRDLYGRAHDFIQQEARETALRKYRQNELWDQAPSIMRTPSPPIMDNPGEPDEPKSAFADALKAARKESQEYLIAFPLSKKCVLGIKRFDREKAEREARAGIIAPGTEKASIDVSPLHCKN
jgi:hypothetical protein